MNHRHLIEEAIDALKECADEIEGGLRLSYMPTGVIHPALQRRFDRDMEIVRRSRAIAAALTVEHERSIAAG